jgi:hypothetical protein
LGTRTPAPQPLHRIFLPASSALVTNFREHAGHRNVTTGGGTVRVFPHPRHAIACPAWDNSAWLMNPQARQVHGMAMGDRPQEV